MRLHSIKAHNFMSLRDCSIDKLDDHLNFLVGPNGCGKTTVFRALKAFRDIFDPSKATSFDQLCSRGVSPQEIDLILDVEFNTQWEQELITAFLCASLSRPDELRNALLSKLPQPNIQLESGGYVAFSNWLLRVLHPEAVPFLFRGKLHVSYHSQVYESLRISYTFYCECSPITITARPIDSILLRGSMPENISGGYSAVNTLIDFFHDTGELGNIVNLLTQRDISAINLFDPVACLLYLAEKKVMLGINAINSQQAFLPAYRRLAELSGNLDFVSLSNRSFMFGYILQILLQHAFVFTNNLRVPVSDHTSFKWDEVTKSHVDLDDERQIPLLLYRLKNGNFAERARLQRIQESFRRLVGEDLGFDIDARHENNQQPALSIDIRVTDPEGDISLTYHGAGIWEALILSTLLYESEGRIVLLDEPASNLHPGMQHKVMETLRNAPGQFIVVTHSAHMLPTRADDFRKVRRMQKDSPGTRIMGLGNSCRLNQERLEQELTSSSDVAGLLFANAVVLVEGGTEIGAIGEWFPQSAAAKGRTFAGMNIVQYSVEGKQNFPFYLRFLSSFGVPWVVICDGDALPPDRDRNSNLWRVLQELQLIQNIPNGVSFEILKAQAEIAGVYTANTSPDGKFERIPDVKQYLEDPNNRLPSGSDVRRGRYIAQNIPCPQEVEEVLQRVSQRLGG